MWLQTKIGFYSVVEHDDDVQTVLIRARSRTDLENLCDVADAVRRDYAEGEALGIDHKAIQFTPNADYHYRIICPRVSWMEVSLRLMTEIDYGNFKNAVSERDPDRSHLYHSVWNVLYSIQARDDRSYGDGYGGLPWDDWADDKPEAEVEREPDPGTEEAIIKDFLDGCGEPR